MEILLKKKSVDMKENITYLEQDPVICKDEEIRTNKFIDDLLLIQKIHNQFSARLLNSFWSLNDNKFKKTWNEVLIDYKKYRKSDEKKLEKSDKDLEFDFKKNFIRDFVCAFQNKEKETFLKDNLNEVVKAWGKVLNSGILVTILWQMNFKEASMTLLKTVPCKFKQEQYEYIYDEFVKNFTRHDLPINITEKNELLNQEMLNFIVIQDKYTTFKKINDKLIIKNVVIKSLKI